MKHLQEEDMGYKFMMPTLSLMGEGALVDAGDEIKDLGFKKALIVTDENLVAVKLTEKLTAVLDQINVDYVIYDKTKPNPTVTNVNEGIEVFKNEDCDFVISFGGGSPHDCAKGIALVLANGGEITDYEGVNISKKPQLPLIAINTTAGTASEMTVFTIITNEETHIKMAIVDKHILPIIAVNDPLVMHAMPKGLTASTGMDALTHAIEAYVSTAATPVTDACAQKAIELIAKNLHLAVEDGSNAKARDNMAYAEYLAGMAFSNASLGYVHAMAHQLGGFYDLPHGVCNAILLPHVQKYNATKVADKLKEVGIFMGLDIATLSDEEGAIKTIEAITNLSQLVNIPSGLTTLGVKENDFPILADNALKDACGITNPIQPTKEEIIEIFKAAM